MPLIACAECQAPVSPEAITCPACGFPLARKRAISGIVKLVIKLTSIAGFRSEPAPAVEGPEYRSYVPAKALEVLQENFTATSKGPRLGGLFGIGTFAGGMVPIFAENGRLYGLVPRVETVLGVRIWTSAWYLVERAKNGEHLFIGRVRPAAVNAVIDRERLLTSRRQATGTSLVWSATWIPLILIVYLKQSR